ncbi:hypothetical protein B0H13DRAFT_1051597 [Mycena leptocephala]|nr:hypothetical protein B0H13DRAFT_1051597 [Mycena leptocephala]
MASSPRRSHRKRISALRLSSDTLPEYIGWRDVVPPPEYEAEDAADADEDTDSEPLPLPYIPPTPVSPRLAHRRNVSHRRRPSSPLVVQPSQQDVFLDSLLERSVHALELSNALLQSSMAPVSRPSSAFRAESPLTISTSVALPVRMPPPRDTPAWADDLAAIARDVDELLVSSLPASVSPVATRRNPRRPSLDPILSIAESSPSAYSRPASVSGYFTRSASPTASTTSYTSRTTSNSTTSHTRTPPQHRTPPPAAPAAAACAWPQQHAHASSRLPRVR